VCIHCSYLPVVCRLTSELWLKWKSWRDLVSTACPKCRCSFETLCAMFCSPANQSPHGSTRGSGRQTKLSEIVYMQLVWKPSTLTGCFSSFYPVECNLFNCFQINLADESIAIFRAYHIVPLQRSLQKVVWLACVAVMLMHNLLILISEHVNVMHIMLATVGKLFAQMAPV